MSSITTINVSPVSSVSTTSSQNMMAITNCQDSSGTMAIPVVSSAAGTIQATSNPVSTINVKHLPTDNTQIVQVLNKQRLQDLVREVDPNVHPDDDVEELLLQLAEDFIDDVVDTSCRFSKHRNSDTLEVKDVQLSLEKNWNMWIPGFGGEELRPYKKSIQTDAHKSRMSLLKKAKK